LLLALPLLWFSLRDQRFCIVICRSVILLLFIVILADPQSVTEKTRHEERIFAFDLSQSIPESMHRWMESTADSRFSPNQQDRIFVFGSETREVTNWREWLKGENSEQSSIRPGKTSLEKLFTTLLELPAAPRSLFIFSDGSPTSSYRASFTPRRADFDRYAADNQALAWVTVRSKAKVLLLNGRSGGGRYLEEIFKRLGFEVTSRTADSPPAPTGYQVVVFNNAEREKFSTSYLA